MNYEIDAKNLLKSIEYPSDNLKVEMAKTYAILTLVDAIKNK